MNQAIVIIVVTVIGLFFGVLIYLANSKLPDRTKSADKAEAIDKAPPETDCKAVIHCGGRSEAIFSYHGINTCRAAARLLSGYKRCPYACLGLGDCIAVCPRGAISIDDDNNIAVIDYDKCDGCGLCVNECAQNLIKLAPISTQVGFRCNYGEADNIKGRERCRYAEESISNGMSSARSHG